VLIGNVASPQDSMVAQMQSGNKEFLRQQNVTFDAEYHGSMIAKILRYMLRDNEVAEVVASRYP
jgi:hypothetical protein